MAAAQQQDRQPTHFSGCGSFLSHPSLDSLELSHLMEAEHNGTVPQQNVATAYEELIKGWNNLIDDRGPSAYSGGSATAVDSILGNNHNRWISELANAASGKSDRNLPNFFQSTTESFVGSDYCLNAFDNGEARTTHPNLAAPPGPQCSENALLERGADNVVEGGMEQSYNVSQDVFNQLAEIDCSQPMMLMADSQPFYSDLYQADAVQGNRRNTEVWNNENNENGSENVPMHNRNVRAERLHLFNGSQGDSSSLSSNEGATPLAMSNMPSTNTRSNRRRSFQIDQSGMHQQFDRGDVDSSLNVMRQAKGSEESSVSAPAVGGSRRHRKSLIGGVGAKRPLEDSLISSNCGGGWNGGNSSRRHLCSGGGGGGNANGNINRSFSSSLSKFTLPDENGKRKIRHDIMSIAESLPSLPGLYFDKKQKGFRVRYQNVYVGWVALSRFPSIEEAYCSARDIWENAKAHAEKFQTPHAAVMASLPLQKEAQASGKNRGGRPRTVTQLPPSTAEWLASAFCSQQPPNSSAWGSKYHQQLLSTDSLLSITERENAAAWKSVANELALRAANGTLDLHTLQMAGITESDLLETLQAESQWTPPPGYAHSNAILTPSSTKASETSPPLSEHLYQSGPQHVDPQDTGHCYNPNLMGDVSVVGGTLGGAISFSKPVEDESGQYGLSGSFAAEQAALACWAGSGATVDNFCTLSGTLTACNDPALSVWDVGNDEQAAIVPEGGGGGQQHH